MISSQYGKYLVIGFLLVFGVIVAYTFQDYGLGWDEPLYYKAGDSYIQWFPVFFQNIVTGSIDDSLSEINTYWLPNAQHPPLVKVITGLTHSLFGSYRLSELLWMLLLLGGIYYIAWKEWGAAAGWFALLATALSPRLFADAHIVELDLPLSVLWVFTLYAYYRGIDNWKWSLGTGFLFGLGLLTKITGIFILIPLVIWGQCLFPKKQTRNILSMLGIGIPVFFIGWPWLWISGPSKLIEFYRIFLTFKSPLQTYYFGQSYSSTPWHYPWIMTLLTIPFPILIFSGWGIYKGFDQKSKPLMILIIINILFFLLLFSMPGTLVIDGIRYFLPVIPLISLLGGYGFYSFIEYLKERQKYSLHLLLGIQSLIFIPLLVINIYIHPAQLSYYNLFIGGPYGAWKAGMETTYWGEVINPETIDWMNEMDLRQHSHFIRMFCSTINKKT
jgi:4-amino-4-deoxy-L-arabinose transferase-like glycosyltransferase